MFFRVDEAYGHTQIFGFNDENAFEIDPHEIFRVRTIGYDNIHRGVINGAASSPNYKSFCKQLFRRFKGYDHFRVVTSYYPQFVTKPHERYQRVLYNCTE